MNAELSGDTAPRLDLPTARLLIDRGIAKATELLVRGTFAVCDEGGILISMTRMQGANVAGSGITPGKAILAALHQEPSSGLDRRMRETPGRFHAFHDLHPDMYPGPGGMYVKIKGRIIGGFATGTGFGPLLQIKGLPPETLTVDGNPVNAEDLITAHALGIEYVEQHAGLDLRKRNQDELDERNIGERAWGDDAGPWVDTVGITRPSLTVARARRVADAVLAVAAGASSPIAVAIFDEVGASMQIDRTIDAAPRAVKAAEGAARDSFGTGVATDGGRLLEVDGAVIGSVGIGGAEPGLIRRALDAAIAAL